MKRLKESTTSEFLYRKYCESKKEEGRVDTVATGVFSKINGN